MDKVMSETMVKAAGNPWLKFFPSDWRADPALRMCSIAARGLWMEMLCVMHENRGELTVNGKAIGHGQLAALAGCQDVDQLLSELEDAGVFSRRDDGTIYSRRMVRDILKAESDKANGKKGGNPAFKQRDNPQANPSGNPEVKAQRPETRDQRPETLPPTPQGGGTGNLFEELTAVFPKNPSSRLDKARRWFDQQPDAAQRSILAAAKAYEAWFWKEQRRRGRSEAEAISFASPLHSWLIDGGWKSVNVASSTTNAEQMEKLNRMDDEALWLACERMQGKKAPTSDSTWSFRRSVVEQARRLIENGDEARQRF